MLNRVLWLLILLLALAGCSTTPVVQNRAAPGVDIETLQGSVNISLTTPAGQLSGNGILVYRRPDSFRLSVLAPFGQIVFDIIVTGDKVVCLQSSKKNAWVGTLADLSPALGTRVWPLLQWAVESPRPAGPSLERIFTREDGTREKVFYDPAGFAQRKVNGFGDEVFYSDYRPAGNASLPNRMEINAAEGSRLVLTFDEPDLNLPVEEGVLNPDLGSYQILPLAAFKGF